MEKVLWGTKKGLPAYMEELLEEHIKTSYTKEDLKKKYPEYDRFRISVVDMEVPPDFAGTINKKGRR